MAKSHVTADRLREILHYDPETGRFSRLTSRGGEPAGKEAGTVGGKLPYRVIIVDYRHYYAHRLAFLYMNGSIPEVVDHINGNKVDNRWCNLRASTKRLNGQNQRSAHRDSKTGLLGSSRSGDKFAAWIDIGGARRKYLGLFATPEEAHAVYLAAKRLYHEANTL